MIRFKFDVASALKTAGMTAYTAQKSGILSQDTWRKIKGNNANISMKSLNNICALLNMQPEHLIYYEKDTEEEKEIKEKIKK